MKVSYFEIYEAGRQTQFGMALLKKNILWSKDINTFDYIFTAYIKHGKCGRLMIDIHKQV